MVYAGKVAYKYKGTCPSSIVIKEGTLGISGLAFCDCKNLTSVTIPDGVTNIGYGAFDRCAALASINIPDSVTSMGMYVLSRCEALESITIPDSVTEIDYALFGLEAGCKTTIICHSGSYVEEYAKRYNYKYQLID